MQVQPIAARMLPPLTRLHAALIVHPLVLCVQAFGMMGWRMGYIAYPEDGSGAVAEQLLKVQDTIPVCPTQIRCALCQLGWLLGLVAEQLPKVQDTIESPPALPRSGALLTVAVWEAVWEAAWEAARLCLGVTSCAVQLCLPLQASRPPLPLSNLPPCSAARHF